jgi:hypothetical protein
LTVSEREVAEWARAHGGAFEVEPLLEIVRGRRVQVGFTLRLSARLPMEGRSREQRWAEAAEIEARLRGMLEAIAPPAGSPARLEIEPHRKAAILAPGADVEPEIEVSARVFHGENYFAEATVAEEKRAYAWARRLAEMGLVERRRPLR